ncbi:MAG: ORF6N domain-containing protein [Bacteroidales bacterium]|jgi:phage regulator Rha-like protein|nr:ORF6N domain-containing protein [Bacteroidales bacterium]
MTEIIKFEEVQNKIISLRDRQVIIDSDVAKLYGVETRDINKSVQNNPKKFPEGYIITVQSTERQQLVENFHRFKNLKHSTSTKAFTEKGLYMLATILKSERATQTTIAIVEAFAKLREVARNLEMLNSITPETIEVIEPEVISHTGGLINELLFSGSPTSAETSVELNLGFAKVKRSIKSENSELLNKIASLEKMIAEINKRLSK